MGGTKTRGLSLLIILVGIALAVIYRSEINPLAIRSAVMRSPLAPIIFIALQVMASLLFVPRSILGIAAGLLFGLLWGSVWAIAGALAGAAAGFAFVRWLGVRGTLGTSPGIGKLIERAEGGGWRAVAIVRLIPLPHSVANTLLALTNLSWRAYLIGSLVGMIPMSLLQVDIGAAGGLALSGDGRWVFGCLLLAIGLAVSFAIKRIAQPSSHTGTFI